MAELDDKPSVNTGYNSTGDSATLDEESGLTLGDIDAVASMLSIRIGADYGIELPQSVHMAARAGLSGLIKRGATIPTVNYTGRMPRGLGNTNNRCNNYIDSYYRNIEASADANHFKVNSFINWPVDFTSWLLGDTLTDVVWVAQNNKIKIENETFANGIATAKLTFNNVGIYKIEVTGTTANGQVVATIDFAISDKLEQ